MEEKKQVKPDKRLFVPAEANRNKHIDFRDVEQENVTHPAIHKQNKQKQKEWEEGIQEGDAERNRSDDPPKSDSPMRMDDDETIGIP